MSCRSNDEGNTTGRVVVLGDEHPKEGSNQGDSYGRIHSEEVYRWFGACRLIE